MKNILILILSGLFFVFNSCSNITEKINIMTYNIRLDTETEGKLGTNPEELIAAAHAGCFNMKLSFVLNEAGYNPVDINTNAELTFVDGKIISIELNLSANVPGVSEEEFKELAEDAKKNCPISGALNCDIILNPSLI